MARYGGQGSNPAGRNRYSTLGKSASQQRADTRRQGATEKRETAYSPAGVAQVTSSSSPSDWLGQNNAIVDRPRISPSTVVGRRSDTPARPGDVGGSIEDQITYNPPSNERSPEQYQMDLENERHAEEQKRADTRRQQAQTARQKAREGKSSKASPVNTKLTRSINNVRQVTAPNTRPPRSQYQTLKPAEGQLSSTARLENDQIKYSLPSHTPLVELTGRDKTIGISGSGGPINKGMQKTYPDQGGEGRFSVTNIPHAEVKTDRYLRDDKWYEKGGWNAAKGYDYQGNILSPDRLAEKAADRKIWFETRAKDASDYQIAGMVADRVTEANQSLVHPEASKAGSNLHYLKKPHKGGHGQSYEDHLKQTGELGSDVTYDMVLTARDHFLARSDLTDAAKEIIRDTPIVAHTPAGAMGANARGFYYNPDNKDMSYQDIDRLAGIFGHEAIHVLDDVSKTSRDPGADKYISELKAAAGIDDRSFQQLVADITQPALAKYTGRGDDIPEALYDPTDIKAWNEGDFGAFYPQHQYTYFGEQKAWAIPPELQGKYDYFTKDAFKLPAGTRWELYTPNEGKPHHRDPDGNIIYKEQFRKWRVVEKSGSEPSNVLPRQTLRFTGAKGQTSSDDYRDIRDLFQGQARYQ